MLPFPILNNYGNIIPKAELKKMDFTGATKNSNTDGNYFGAILMNNGKLYGFGQNLSSIFGISTTMNGTISLALDNVDNFWLMMNGILVRTTSGEMLYRGKYLNGIFCPNNATLTPYITAGWLDVTSYFSTIGVGILDAVCIGNYPDQIAQQSRASSTSLFVVSSSGVVYGMGYNDQLLISAGGGSTAIYTNFTSTSLTSVSSLRATPYMTHQDSKVNYSVIYAIKTDGTVWAKGTNIRSGIRTPAYNEYVTTWTQVQIQTPLLSMTASNEGAIYNTATAIYGLGGAGQSSYNLGLARGGTNNVNTATGLFNTVLSYREVGGTTNILFSGTAYISASTRIKMYYGGSIIYNVGSTEIFTAHGTYSDAATTANAYFTREDIGIPVQEAIYLSQLYYSNLTNPSVRGILILGTDGSWYVRGIINGVTYNTFTEINFL